MALMVVYLYSVTPPESFVLEEISPERRDDSRRKRERKKILLFLLSNQKVAFEYLLSNRLSPSNICFQTIGG